MRTSNNQWKTLKLTLHFVCIGINYPVNQGMATLAFFGVGVNLVLFLTRVLGQDNAKAANNVSKWTGTVYLFSLLGAFLSDSYLGRYKTCAIFQAIFVIVSCKHLIFSPIDTWAHKHTDVLFSLEVRLFLKRKMLKDYQFYYNK